MLTRRVVGLLLFAIIAVPTFAPAAAATEWDDDNWLWNIIGPERLALGDEFGCHGYEGVDIHDEPWAISGCRDYLTAFTNASRWGQNPVSFGVPAGEMDSTTADHLHSSGFRIVGDLLESTPSQLHKIDRTTSLEKGQTEMSALEDAAQDELVSIYWVARWHDVKIREDKSAISLLESQDVWFTTWGEWYMHERASHRIGGSYLDNQTIAVGLPEDELWRVPGSVLIEWEIEPETITMLGGVEHELSADEQHLHAGYRFVENGLIATLSPGEYLSFSAANHAPAFTITPMTTFNGLHHSVVIVGHHVTNLHEWSSDFYDSPLRFTWLIERPAALVMDWRLPVIAVAVLIATPVTIKFLVKRDQRISEDVGSLDSDTD